MGERLRGRVAFITGAGLGIGREAAVLFAEEGARVVAADIDAKAAKETAARVEAAGGEAVAVVGDVAVEDDVARMVGEGVSRFGAVHVLYANAGVLWKDRDRSVLETDASGEFTRRPLGAGHVALEVALRSPERVSALILLCPDAPPGMPVPPRFVFDTLLRSDFLYWAIFTFFSQSVRNATGMVPKGYILTPEDQAAIKTVLRGNLPMSTRIDGFIFETYTTAAEYQASISATNPYPLSKIETPVLVLDALDDPITIPENVRRLAEQMPNARLFMVPDGGHFFFGRTEEVKDEIARFLRNNVAELQTKRILT